MGGLLSVVLGFFEDIFDTIADLVSWIGELANKLMAIDLQASSVNLILGNFRYLVGDTLYLTFITSFYVGVFMIAFKTIPIVVSWWKHFLPTS